MSGFSQCRWERLSHRSLRDGRGAALGRDGADRGVSAAVSFVFPGAKACRPLALIYRTTPIDAPLLYCRSSRLHAASRDDSAARVLVTPRRGPAPARSPRRRRSAWSLLRADDGGGPVSLWSSSGLRLGGGGGLVVPAWSSSRTRTSLRARALRSRGRPRSGSRASACSLCPTAAGSRCALRGGGSDGGGDGGGRRGLASPLFERGGRRPPR